MLQKTDKEVLKEFRPTNDPPSRAFDLKEWKLQVPGPKEIRSLDGFASPEFSLDFERRMCFLLDAAAKGTTPNAKYVRSELRHLKNWPATERHVLSAEVRAYSTLDPDKLTVLQIHGITEAGGDAPPLLRVALQGDDLYAVIQTSTERGKNDKVLLRPGLKDAWVAVEIVVDSNRLIIAIDGRRAVDRSLAFWTYPNYFKAGCYPQATMGLALVQIRKLTVR